MSGKRWARKGKHGSMLLSGYACIIFHLCFCWKDYPRSLTQDLLAFRRALNNQNTVGLPRIKSLLLPYSDRMSCLWLGSHDPHITIAFDWTDPLFIRDRPIRGKLAFAIVMFAAYLKRIGDFASASKFYTVLSKREFIRAEGHLGLADIHHLLADWKLELAPYKAAKIYPTPTLAAAEDRQDFVWRLDEFSHQDAERHYDAASKALPKSAYPLLRLSMALVSDGRKTEAVQVIDKAADLASDNEIVELNRAYIHALTNQPGWRNAYSRSVSKSPFLIQRQPKVVRALVVSTREAAAELGIPVTEITPDETLSYSFRATIDGVTSKRLVSLYFPAPVAADFPDVADLGLGLKLVADRYLLGDGRGLQLRQAKMFCPDILAHDDEIALIGRPDNLPTATSKRGTPILLPGATFNYYHWMFDSLGSLCLYGDHASFNDREILCGRPIEKHQNRSLSLMPKKFNLRFVRDLSSFTFDRATHIQYPAQFNIPHPTVISRLRSLLSRHSHPKTGKRVYITRRASPGRSAKNEEMIENRLRRAGFAVCDPGRMSLDEQIDFFSDVEALAAEPGAALTNLIFCPSETKLLIMASALHHFETFTAISGTIGQPTYACFGASTTQPNSFFAWSVFQHVISESDLTRTLITAQLS
jgi:capsular polysaccharide biosynthesis protein